MLDADANDEYLYINTPRHEGIIGYEGATEGAIESVIPADRPNSDDQNPESDSEIRVLLSANRITEEGVCNGQTSSPITDIFDTARDTYCDDQTKPDNAGNNPGRPLPLFAPDAAGVDNDTDKANFSNIRNEFCTQCFDQDTDIGDRHFFTHVRTIVISDNEPLSNTDATSPRTLDSFTICNAFQIASWQAANIYDSEIIKAEGRLPYWKTPDFYVKALINAKNRLNRTFPFNFLSSTAFAWNSTPILITYTSIDGKHSSITPPRVTSGDVNRLPTPRHEQIHIMSKQSQWVDSCIHIWFHVSMKKLPYPQHIVSSAEEQYITRIRDLIADKNEPLKLVAELLFSYNTLVEATVPALAQAANLKIEQREEKARSEIFISEETKSMRKTLLRHNALKRAINQRLGKIDNTLIFRNGSQKPLSTLQMDSSLHAQRQKRKKQMKSTRQEITLSGEPECKKMLFSNKKMTSVKSANKNRFQQSSNSSKKSTLIQATPKSNRFQYGNDTPYANRVTYQKWKNQRDLPIQPICQQLWNQNRKDLRDGLQEAKRRKNQDLLLFPPLENQKPYYKQNATIPDQTPQTGVLTADNQTRRQPLLPLPITTTANTAQYSDDSARYIPDSPVYEDLDFKIRRRQKFDLKKKKNKSKYKKN